jgi:hypothetical protein
MTIGSTILRGCRLLPAAAFVSLVALAPAYAQRAVPETVPKMPSGTGGGAGGIGGGAGVMPPLPEFRSRGIAPAPQVAPAVPAAPAAPAAVVRFRCQLDAGAEICKGPPAPDGGGEEECNCARDYCRDDPAGYRVCEKQ